MRDNKQRIFELMSKVDESFTAFNSKNNPSGCFNDSIKVGTDQEVKKIDEYDNYPAGADLNPNAPWNQSNDSVNNIEVNFDKRYPYTFTIDLHSNDGGYASFDGYNLVERSKNPEIQQYFNSFENGLSFDVVNSPEFIAMANKLFNEVVSDNEIEWEYDESVDEVYDNGEDMSKINTSQLPVKLYCGNHLGNTAKYLSQNIAYIHWFDADRDNHILCYTKPSNSDELVYEFDVQKMINKGFSVKNDQHQDMRNVWVVIPPKEYAHKNTIRFIDEYMTKVIVDLKSFSLIYDINDKLDFVKKFGMPTIPMEIKNNTENVSSSKLPDYSMNEKKV